MSTAGTHAAQLALPGMETPPGRIPTYQRHPAPRGSADTSRLAASEADERAPSRRQIVRDLIRGRGEQGATIDELQLTTGWLVQSVCPIVRVLVECAEVIDSGRRRPTRSGAPAKIWIPVRRM